MNPRAWASVYAVCAAIGLALLLALMPRPSEPEALAQCRVLVASPAAPLDCLDGLTPDIVAAELAGSARRWRCIVHRGEVHQPTLAQRECAEQRSERLRGEVRGFDQGVFMPLYAGLSLLLAAWAWSHGRLRATPPPWRMRRLSLALVAATVGVVGLDLWENQRLLLVLDALDREGVALLMQAVVPGLEHSLDAAAQGARRASAWKWLACAPWALCLGLTLWAVLRWDPMLVPPRPWSWLCRLAWLAAAGAAAMMAVGGATGLWTDGLVLPVLTLRGGSVALVVALASAAVAAAWGAMKRGIPFGATPPAPIPGPAPH